MLIDEWWRMKYFEIYVKEWMMDDGLLEDLCKQMDDKEWNTSNFLSGWMIKDRVLQDVYKQIEDRGYSALRVV